MFGRKKYKHVAQLVRDHAALVGEAVAGHRRLLDAYLAGADIRELYDQIDALESRADIVRIEAEHEMYQGGLLPTQREDLVLVLEMMDRIANKAEDFSDFVSLVRPPIPAFIAEDVRRIAQLTEEGYAKLVAVLERALSGDYDIRREVTEVGDYETRIDKLQYAAVERVYRDDSIEKVDKLVLLMTVDKLGHLADFMENAADKLSLIAIKRKLA